MNIANLIQDIAGTKNDDKVRLFYCEVNSVDSEKRTCNVTTINGQATLTFDAQLMAGVSDGLLAIPVIGSLVYVLHSKYTLPFVVLYSDIEKHSIKGEEFGGLVKVIELTQKLNALENKVNQIISTYNTHVHSALNVPSASIIADVLIPTQQIEIENVNINHGE